MSRNKKGTELSINTIIIIAISLLVLLILVFLVMKGAGSWTKGTSCDTQGGVCYTIGPTAADKKCPSGTPIPSTYSCSTAGQTCCINVGGLGD
jgi:hypothetical protein